VDFKWTCDKDGEIIDYLRNRLSSHSEFAKEIVNSRRICDEDCEFTIKKVTSKWIHKTDHEFNMSSWNRYWVWDKAS